MKYITEIHCHSCETSGCSSLPGAKLAELYKSNNYDAITITDHFDPHFFESRKNNSPGVEWKELVDEYLRGYRAAKKAGDELGLSVILGLELRFTANFNDYLIFGVNEEFLYANAEFYKLGIENFINLSRKNNLITIQAHPFRNGMVRVDPIYLDGIETYNGHPWHNSDNKSANELYESVVKTQPFIKTAGSDCHNLDGEARAGIITDTKPTNSVELKNLLQSGEYGFYLNAKN